MILRPGDLSKSVNCFWGEGMEGSGGGVASAQAQHADKTTTTTQSNLRRNDPARTAQGNCRAAFGPSGNFFAQNAYTERFPPRSFAGHSRPLLLGHSGSFEVIRVIHVLVASADTVAPFRCVSRNHIMILKYS